MSASRGVRKVKQNFIVKVTTNSFHVIHTPDSGIQTTIATKNDEMEHIIYCYHRDRNKVGIIQLNYIKSAKLQACIWH